MANSLKLVAAVLVVVGTLVLAFQSGALSSVTADRDVSGNVADDQNAYLAIEDTYAGQTVRNYFEFCGWWGCFTWPVDRPRTVASVENRYAADYTDLTVSVYAITGASDAVLEVRNEPTSLTAGGSGSADLGCSGDLTDNGTVDVVVEFDASGANIDVDDARVTVTDVTYDCIQR